MTPTMVLSYFFATTCIVASLYVAISKDMLRGTIAFFVELAAISGVLLTLNADYLAVVVFVVALLGTVLVISFSSVITGSLKSQHQSQNAQTSVARVLGMFLGLGLGATIGWAFLSISYSTNVPAALSPAAGEINAIGRMMLGEQLVVLELLAMIVLIVVVGAGLLLRKPST